MGDCVIAIRKSLTAKFMIKKLGGVRSFLLLKHMIEPHQVVSDIKICSLQNLSFPQNLTETVEEQQDTQDLRFAIEADNTVFSYFATKP